MTIGGHVLLRTYNPPTAVAPNPDIAIAQPLALEIGEVLVCPQTGRMWLMGQVGNAGVFHPILPHVRADAPATTATVASNSNGVLSVGDAAGSTDGAVNLFNYAYVDASGVRLQAHDPNSILILDSDNYVRSSSLGTKELTTDFTLTDTVNPTTITVMNFTPTEAGKYQYDVKLQFFHNNIYSVSAGIYLREGAGINTYLSTGTVSQQSGGWASINMTAVSDLQAISHSLRVSIIPSVTGVLLKRQSEFAFPIGPLGQDFAMATRALVRRIG